MSDKKIFESEDWFKIAGRGNVATVDTLDICDPFDVKPGQDVIIDGHEYHVIGVEHRGSMPIIGILVRGDRKTEITMDKVFEKLEEDRASGKLAASLPKPYDTYYAEVLTTAVTKGLPDITSYPRDRAELVLHVLADKVAKQQVELDNIRKEIEKIKGQS